MQQREGMQRGDKRSPVHVAAFESTVPRYTRLLQTDRGTAIHSRDENCECSGNARD